MSKRFYETRQMALVFWAVTTGRKVYKESEDFKTDNFSGAFECQWQNAFKSGHVNLFCSLGGWACNLTDILKDSRYDMLFFDDKEEARILFRYYTRILLIVSELLTDFQDIYLQCEGLSPQKKQIARNFYSEAFGKDRYSEILNYINSVCKHKTQHIHICDNHSRTIFEDSDNIPSDLNYVSLSDNSTVKHKNAILIPKLIHIISSVTLSYAHLDQYFKTNGEKFEIICKKYCT